MVQGSLPFEMITMTSSKLCMASSGFSENKGLGQGCSVSRARKTWSRSFLLKRIFFDIGHFSPSYPKPLFQSEAKYESIEMKMIHFCTQPRSEIESFRNSEMEYLKNATFAFKTLPSRWDLYSVFPDLLGQFGKVSESRNKIFTGVWSHRQFLTPPDRGLLEYHRPSFARTCETRISSFAYNLKLSFSQALQRRKLVQFYLK